MDHVDLKECFTELEMLKCKIISPSWSKCEVMLHDVEQSRRVRVDGRHPEGLFLSHLFWPEEMFEGKGLLFGGHDLWKDRLEHYQNEFIKSFTGRHVVWHDSLSRVLVGITIAGEEFEFPCSLAQATVIHLIDQHQPIHESDLAGHTPDLSSALSFWIDRKIVTADVEGRLIITSDYQPVSLLDLPSDGQDSASSLITESMGQYWPFIEAMLRNLGDLKAERIHANLGMFASDYSATLEQLAIYLELQTSANELIKSSSGSFSLPK